MVKIKKLNSGAIENLGAAVLPWESDFLKIRKSFNHSIEWVARLCWFYLSR